MSSYWEAQTSPVGTKVAEVSVTTKEDVLGRLREAVLKGSEEEAALLARKGLDAGIDPVTILEEAMAPAIRETGDKFIKGELFLPDIWMAGEAMKAGMTVLLPVIIQGVKEGRVRRKGKVMIGTVEGDVHGLGKDVITALLQADGFDVVNLGVDIPVWTFVEKLRTEKPDVLGAGSYMSTSLFQQKNLAEALKKSGLRGNVKYIVGGVACTKEWADKIGADGYARDAHETVDLCRKFVEV